jgi:hypothetical protein
MKQLKKELQLFYIDFLNEFVGNLIVDLELKRKSEDEIIESLKNLKKIFLIEVKNSFVDAENLEIDDIELILLDKIKISKQKVYLPIETIEIDNNVLNDLKIDKLSNNQSLLFFLAVKNEMLELVRYIYSNSDSVVKPHWTLPISEYEFCKLANYEKLTLFFRRYK